MTYAAFLPSDFASDAPIRLRRTRKPSSQSLLCAAALVLSASVGVGILYVPLHTASKSGETAMPAAPVSGTAHASLNAHAAMDKAVASLRGKLQSHQNVASAPPVPYSGLLDPGYTGGGLQPLEFARVAPLRTALDAHQIASAAAAEAQQRLASAEPATAQVGAPPQAAPVTQTELNQAELTQTEPAQTVPSAEPMESTEAIPAPADVPMPARRPAFLPPEDAPAPVLPGSRRIARAAEPTRVPVPAPVAPAQPSFFQKLFGALEQPRGALAYATPDFGGRSGLGDGGTAIYDIAAHTVYLPDGTRLEAHSGLGVSHDNPSSVAEHMRGVTPPNVYELTYREALFHGVRALRLTPVGNGYTYGRAGLLAHSYMLGPRGDSNGCVVFRNYQAFLHAYESGAIRRLIVVASRG